MTEKTARQYGKEAYKNGIKSAPALDKGFMATLSGQPGSNVKALQEWINGWHEANMEDDNVRQ